MRPHYQSSRGRTSHCARDVFQAASRHARARGAATESRFRGEAEEQKPELVLRPAGRWDGASPGLRSNRNHPVRCSPHKRRWDFTADARSPMFDSYLRMDLTRLGLTPDVEAAFARAAKEWATKGHGRETELALGRVTKIERGFAAVAGAKSEGLLHVPKALSKDPESTPATGDWVLVSLAKNVVLEVLPRRSKFVRGAAGSKREPQVVATNVDRLFIIMGLDKDFNLRRLERYIVLAEESQAAAVVFLTKAGLVTDAAEKETAAREAAHGVPVHVIDVVSGIETQTPWQYFERGETVAVIGSSGAGKSTLANFLLGADVQRTNEVRGHDDRGKHTTTRREMFVLARGGTIIDTPGLRELSMWADAESFLNAFDDVKELALACRFSNCSHVTESGCAVAAAIASGALAPERLASYRQLEHELRGDGRPSSGRERHSSRIKRKP